MRVCTIIFLLCAILTSCTSTKTYPVYEIPSLSERTKAEIESAIASGEPLKAIQELDAMKREHPSDAGIEELEEDAVKKVVELYEKSLADKDYARAVVIFRSAQNAGFAHRLSGPSETELLISRARELYAGGSPVPALVMFRDLLENNRDHVSDDVIREIGFFALEERNTLLLKEVLAALTERGVTPPEELSKSLSVEKPLSEVMKGTVTIWVNRGMKVQGGVGFPDRVIGSGFFIDKRGYLLTNYHVITSEVDPTYEGYSRLYVRLPGSQDKIPARVVGWDRIFDIALLKVEYEPDFIFSFDTKEELDIGEKIFAIGSPGGLESTLTAGIVSATGRRFLQIGDVIQVDVPINAGNSGGPLLDASGDLVGIVFAGIEQFEGINFAIPAHWVHNLLPSLYRGKEVLHPWVGLAVSEVEQGLEVLYVAKGSPAERAGIHVSDIITKVSGIEIKTIRNGQKEILKDEIGTIIPLHFLRDGDAKDALICLDSRPFSPIESALKIDSRENLIYALFGMQIEEAGSSLAQKNYLIKKVYKGSVADETGLSVNDPLSILSFQVDLDARVVLLQIRIKKRKAGFIESAIQLGSPLEIEYFL